MHWQVYRVSQLQIEGGPSVVVHADPSAPASAIYLWFPVGSAYEPPGLHGAAHLLEHMLFKGAGGHGPGEAAARIERVGGDINAFTSYEQTVLHCTVPAGHEAMALALLTEMASQPRLDADELKRERDVVIEEIRGVRDEADQVIAQELREAIFPDHGYGRPILGDERSVKGMSRDALLGFHRDHYGLDRAVLAVAGPLPADEIGAMVRGLSLPRSGPAPQALSVPKAGPRRFIALDPGFDDRLIEIAFPVPGLRHPDMAALDMLVTALDGDAGALSRTLRTEQGLAADTWAALEPEPLGSMMVFGLAAREGRAEEAVLALSRALARVADEGISAAALHRARRAALVTRLYEHETVDGRAFRLAWYQAFYGDPEGEAWYESALTRVSPADIARVAKTWLNPAVAVVAGLAPKKALGKQRLQRAFEQGFAVNRPPRPSSPSLIRERLPNGLTLILAPDSRAELVGLSLVGVGGAIAEGARNAGLADVWAATVERGAGSRDATGIAGALDALGGRLSTWGWRNSQGLTASFPAGDLAEGVELLGDLLASPTFAADELARARDELSEAAASIEDSPSDLAMDLAWQALFPGHPWGRPSHGTPAGLARVTRRRLLDFHRRALCGNNLALALAGAVDEGVLPRLRRALGRLPAGAAIAPRPAIPAELFVRQRVRRLAREQAWVVLAFPGAGWGEPAAPALALAEAILGGQSGRLFTVLREQHGLAYDVSASSEEGLGGGAFFVSIGTDPERVGEATDLLWSVLDGLGQEPVGGEELALARARLVDGVAIELQRSSALAGRLAAAERYGPGAERFREALLAPAAVSPESLVQGARATFRRDRHALIRVEPSR